MSEQGFQSKVIKELRQHAKFVLKTQAGRGVPILYRIKKRGRSFEQIDNFGMLRNSKKYWRKKNERECATK